MDCIYKSALQLPHIHPFVHQLRGQPCKVTANTSGTPRHLARRSPGIEPATFQLPDNHWATAPQACVFEPQCCTGSLNNTVSFAPHSRWGEVSERCAGCSAGAHQGGGRGLFVQRLHSRHASGFSRQCSKLYLHVVCHYTDANVLTIFTLTSPRLKATLYWRVTLTHGNSWLVEVKSSEENSLQKNKACNLLWKIIIIKIMVKWMFKVHNRMYH